MSSETKYINSSYQDFFEKSLSKSDPDLFKEPIDEKWKQFFNNFKSGPMGEKLHRVWSGPGNQALSAMVLSCIDKNLRN